VTIGGFGRCVLTSCVAVAMLAGCGGGQSTPAGAAIPQSMQESLEARPSLMRQSLDRGKASGTDRSGRPKIFHISRIVAKQTQQITIVGTNFGTYQPYDGDSNYLKMTDIGRTMHHYEWAAGCEGPPPCGTTLNVTSWTDDQIVLAGFTGTYHENPLRRRDFLVWWVVNPQTGKGPSAYLVQVKP